MQVSVDLADRTLHIGDTQHTLSNETIRQLREIADRPFDEDTAAEAVNELIDQQIRPFLQDANRPVTTASIEQEVDEAFETHLYLHHQRVAE